MMNKERFQVLREMFTSDRCRLADMKNVKYSNGSEDRFGNFKRLADDFSKIGATQELIAAIFLKKHIDAIFQWINSGCPLAADGDEPIEGRIKDAANYLDIIYAMVQERRDGSHSYLKQGDGDNGKTGDTDQDSHVTGT